MAKPPLRLLLLALVPVVEARAVAAPQVHHHPDGRPWSRRADRGPDAEVPGWFYQLGVTGIRVKLDDEHPARLIVGHVFDGSPAEGVIEVGDHITGAGGEAFEVPHRNGYGMEVFGPRGPIEDFAEALSTVLLDPKATRLAVAIERDGDPRDVKLKLGRRTTFGADFPKSCSYTPDVLPGLLETLRAAQRDDGSFGGELANTFAPLALLAGGERRDLAAVERAARFHASHTSREDDASLVNWRYTAAGIVLSEWYLASGDRWVLEELAEVRDFLLASQYMSLDEVSPRVRDSHPDSYPTDAAQQHGGWGHNKGFEGYGPIAMVTGQGALAFALMERCGVEVDDGRQRAAYAFLERGTGPNGYTWYGDEVANPEGWADMGRTGAAACAFAASRLDERPVHLELARKQATLMGEEAGSFPDTHGSPLMGMGYGAAGAMAALPGAYDRLMAANRWWFVLADCGDGTFHYQPNRDNAGYGPRARLEATAVVAFVLLARKRSLAMLGG